MTLGINRLVRRPNRLLIALVAVFALVAVSCGSDAGDEGAADAPAESTVADSETTAEPEPEPEDEPEDEPEEAEDESEAAAPAGDPVTVWVIEDSSEALGVTFPAIRAGVQARLDRINAEGGLGAAGHPVNVEFCITNFDPNAAAQCARDAAADDTAIAVAASVSASGDAYLPILEEAGLANIGTTAFTASDGTSPVSFPTMGGLVAITGCMAQVMIDEAGVPNFGIARGDSPGADQVGSLLTALGVPAAGEVVTPLANTDYTAELGALAADVDGILLVQDGGTAIKALLAIDQLGLDIPVAGSAAVGWTPDNIAAAGPAIEGMYVSLWYSAEDGPGVQQFLADMDAVGASELTDDLGKMAWLAFELLDQAVADNEVVDRTTVLDGLNNMSAFDTGGITPVLDYTSPGGLLGGSSPRFVNESCAYGQVQDGVVVGIGPLITPFSG